MKQPLLKIIHNELYPTPEARNKQSVETKEKSTLKNNSALTLVRDTSYEEPSADLRVADLHVEVENIEVATGQIMVAVYDNEANFNRTMLLGTTRAAKLGAIQFSFPKLPVGDYAVMVYHDANNNGKLDRNQFGIPTEPWGGSLQRRKVSGAPGWPDANFNLLEDGLSLTITLQ